MGRVLVGLACCWLAAIPLYGQPAPILSITADFRDRPLTEVIDQLKADHGLRFSYLEEAVASLRANCRFEQADWTEVADCLFRSQGLEVKTISGNYVALRADGSRPRELCLRVVGPDGDPLPFVSAILTGRDTLLSADENGWLRARPRVSSQDSLELHYLGYKNRTVAIRDDCADVTLTAASVELAAVTVTEYLTPGISTTTEGRRILIDPQRTAAVPGFADRGVYRTLTLLPGINNLNETAGELSIRGGTPDQNLILWDGIPVYFTGHYFGMISPFSPQLVDRIDVWRGQAEAAYGGRVSGVIRMSTEDEVAASPSAGIGLSGLQADGDLRLPLIAGKSDVVLGFRTSLPLLLEGPTYRSYRDQALQGSGPGQAITAPNGSQSTTETFNFREFNGRWLWLPAEGHRITLSGFHQYDDARYTTDDDANADVTTDDLESRNLGASLRYARELANGRELRLQLVATDFDNLGENRQTTRRIANVVRRESSIREVSGKAAFRKAYGAGQQSRSLDLGMEWQQFIHGFRLSAENERAGTLRQAGVRGGRAVAAAAFGTYAWSPTETIRLEAGARLPYYSPTKTVYLEPRLNGTLHLTSSWHLRAGLGVNHQFAVRILDLENRRISGSAPLWTMANGGDFPVQSAREFSLGVTGQPGSWLLELEGYHKYVSDLSATYLDLTITGFPIGSSRASGLDLLIKKRWGLASAWVNYSLSKADYLFPDVAAEAFPATTDRRHQLRLVQTLTFHRWELSLGWRLQTGSRYTAYTIGPTRATDGSLRANLLPGGVNAEKLPVYHRADLSLTYGWASGAPSPWSGLIALSLVNVYGRDNLLERDYTLGRRANPDRRNPRFFATTVDRLGLSFTPNVTVSLRWGKPRP